MKLMNILGIIAVMYGVISCGGEKAKTEEIVYYTCPMESHKHVHSAQPGECLECSMKMVPAVKTTDADAEFYGCPMPEHSHVRQAEPGSCDECGMKLVPMRLKKT